ncbi:MAG: ankyrin repeat domain-containing protein [Solirubrobacteraceae bacterium]
MELAAAIRAGEVDTVRAFVAADPALAGARDEQGLPVVLVALFHRRRDIADVLLEAEPELGVLEAAALGRVARLRELLPERLHDRTPDGFTPLHAAAHTDDVEMAELLLSHCADPAITTDDGRDPARLAADDGSPRAAALLSPRSGPSRSSAPGPERAPRSPAA